MIKDNHDPPTCGHLGIFKTLARIAERYYWPNMRKDVAKYIAQCQVCLKTKSVQRPVSGHMLSEQPLCTRPWQILSIDLVGPLPRSDYSYIFSVHDLFSKFVLFFPLRKATANGVVKWLKDHVLLLFGAPDQVIADNGPQFRSKLFTDLMERYKVKVRYTANYHPQANPVERNHRVLKTILTGYVEHDHRAWEQFLPKAGYAMRSAVHEVTKFSPNFIMFGRDLRVGAPSDVSLDNDYGVDSDAKANTLAKIVEDVRKRIKEVV